MAIYQVTSRSQDRANANQPSQATGEFLSTAFTRFRLAQKEESEIRSDAVDDWRFWAGDQWDMRVKNQRRSDDRPCLVMNRLRQFVQMVVNEERQQRPGIQINPIGDNADVETAQVFQGIIRHIETNSDAEIAYDTGFQQMIVTGYGYWLVQNDYIDDEGDDQEIEIKRIKDQFTVYYDPRCSEPDYSDAEWCFVIDDMPKEVYLEMYPGSALASLRDFESIGNLEPGWVTTDGVRVAHYYYVDAVVEERGKRRVRKKKIKKALINAVEILDETDVPGCYIPVIPVLGDDVIIDGKRKLIGLIRDTKDPQRVYNYHISAAAESVSLAPKAPFILAEGQTEGHEGMWEQANRRNFAALVYKPTSLAGQPVPPPQRNAAEPPIQAMTYMIRQADNDLKSTTGIYDASLGQQGPEQSGKAVLLRQKQSDIANLNFVDNMGRSIRHTARVILAMIPEVYDKAKVQRIINPDGNASYVGLYNSENEDEPDPAELGAVNKVYDIGVGRYDVTATVGTSYQSKRQESLAAKLALVASYPQIMQVAGDLIIRDMDWPGAKEIAERLKALLPPVLQQQEQLAAGGDPATQLQQAMQQNQVLQQHNSQLLTMLQQLNNTVKSKLLEQQGKMNVALVDQDTKLNVARIMASKDADTSRADREQSFLEQAMGQAHEHGMQAADQAHELAMGQMGQQPQQPGTTPGSPGMPAPSPSAPSPAAPGGGATPPGPMGPTETPTS